MIHKTRDFGYQEHPTNRNGIKRARTFAQLRIWDLPRDKIMRLAQELGGAEFPGVYVLQDTSTDDVYVGEAENVVKRLGEHDRRPTRGVPAEFSRVIVLGDARPTTQSDLSDPTVRQILECNLIDNFLDDGRYEVGNRQKREPACNQSQRQRSQEYLEEMTYALSKMGLLEKPVVEYIDQAEVSLEDLVGKLRADHTVEDVRAYEATVDGELAFIRDGSDKRPRGWQITLRNSLIQAARQGVGYLAVRRGPGLLIPLARVRSLVRAHRLKANTVDIYVVFLTEGAKLVYRQSEEDVSDCILAEADEN